MYLQKIVSMSSPIPHPSLVDRRPKLEHALEHVWAHVLDSLRDEIISSETDCRIIHLFNAYLKPSGRVKGQYIVLYEKFADAYAIHLDPEIQRAYQVDRHCLVHCLVHDDYGVLESTRLLDHTTGHDASDPVLDVKIESTTLRQRH